MMNSLNPKFIIVSVIVGIGVIYIGFSFYMKWDVKQFIESLPTPLDGETPRQEDNKSQTELLEKNTFPEEVIPEEIEERPTKPIESNTYVPQFEPSDQKNNTAVNAETNTPGNFTDVSDQFPYNMQIVKAGFEDYNTYLNTDPEYAYQRLDDAFREQFGDDPDVDILVESIRHYNKGPVPVSMAIRFMEAELRLISKFNFPEPIEQLKNSLELLHEYKQYGLESGEEMLYQSKSYIGGGN